MTQLENARKGIITAAMKAVAAHEALGVEKLLASVADGTVVAQSGLMGPTDEPRLLLVDKLEGVKELVLRVRAGDDEAVTRPDFAAWGDATFYK